MPHCSHLHKLDKEQNELRWEEGDHKNQHTIPLFIPPLQSILKYYFCN